MSIPYQTTLIDAGSYGLKGDGSDETATFAAIATAAGSGGCTIMFPKGSFCTTAFNLSGKKNVTLIGQGGTNLTGTVPGTEFVFTGTGTGVGFNFKDCLGLTSTGIAYAYSSTYFFTGTLLDISSTNSTWSKHLFENATFYQKGTFTGACSLLVDGHNTVDVTMRNVRLSGATTGVRGAPSGTDAASTASWKFYSCDWVYTPYPIFNPGLSWLLVGCNFEPCNSSNDNPTIKSVSPNQLVGFTMIGCCGSDSFGAAAKSWVEADSVFGLCVQGGSLTGNGNNTIGFKLGIGSGSFVSGVSIHGMLWSNMNTGVAFQTAPGSLINVDISANANPNTANLVTGNGAAPTAAWTSYTPTVSSGSGTLTTATATGAYKIIDSKTLLWRATATITDNGTGASTLLVSLPPGDYSTGSATFTGKENGVSYLPVYGVVPASSSAVNVYNFNNTYPAASGSVITIGGFLEIL